MCGIGGIIWHDQLDRRTVLEKGIASLQHRGPDEAGVYYDDYLGLVHTRLSIIDLKSGQQPIVCAESKDVLIFNGEIFNFRELRTLLESKGQNFRTESDTEVLLKMLQVFGTDALRMLNGQFAFAFYKAGSSYLLLARDPFGEKPLFYTQEDHFAFGSEIKFLAAMAGEAPTLDITSLTALNSFWAPVPTESTYKKIHALPPGYFMEVTPGNCSVHNYFAPRISVSKSKVSPEEIRAEIEGAVARRLVADVPVSVYLSGGLDSSVVSYEVVRQSQTAVNSFSIGFENEQFDETGFQQEVSTHLGTNHTSILIGDRDVIDNFEEALKFAESPSSRSAFVPMYLLSKEVSKSGGKVVLTGEGADEMFLGYDLFREVMIKDMIRAGGSYDSVLPILEKLNLFVPNQSAASKFMALKYSNYKKLAAETGPLCSHSERVNLGALTQKFFTDQTPDVQGGWLAYLEGKYDGFAERGELERAKLIEIETLLSGHLLSTQGDRVSMSNGVETRPPFLDMELINFVHSLDLDLFFDFEFGEKTLIKQAYVDDIPTSIVRRTKFPYRAPDSQLFFSDYGRSFVLDNLSSHESELIDVAKFSAYVEKLLGQSRYSPRDNHAFMVIFSSILLEKAFKSTLQETRIPFRELEEVTVGSGYLISYR